MSDWRPVSEGLGKRTRVQIQPDGTFLFLTEQDCDPILDANRLKRDNDPNKGWDAGRDMRHVATIPPVIALKWLVEDGIDVYSPEEHQAAIARKLNDPDWAYLRTSFGHIGVSNGVAR